MSEINVRIVRLEPMRVASAYGFGAQPESMAHEKMNAFLKSNGFLAEYGTKYIHYGFNNPSPAPGSPNYGYEIWVTIPDSVQPQDDIRVVSFPGGLYAVTRFEDLDQIGKVWQELVRWRENSKYKSASHQWLENLINPLETDMHKYIFELYLPVSE